MFRSRWRTGPPAALAAALVAALALLCTCAPAVHAEGWRDWVPEGFIAFPELTMRNRFDADDSFDIDPGTGLFYSRDFGRLLFLAEGYVDRREQELERLQVGWLVDRSNTLWGGRFHTPIGYWNTEYHHGQFLQPTISRPGIVEFEDRGGVLPMHVAGGLLQGTQSLSNGELGYELTIGAGPELADDGLELFAFFHPTQHDHDISGTAKLSWKPSIVDTDEVAAFAGYFDIPSSDLGVSDVGLFVLGQYGVWNIGDVRLLGAVFIAHDEVSGGGSNATNWFASGYLEGEYRISEDWTLYSRVEQSTGSHGDPYLAFFPKYTKRAYVGGFRFEITDHQALKVEFSRKERMAQSFEEVAVQWSAAFP